jgi:hypothetical protein
MNLELSSLKRMVDLKSSENAPKIEILEIENSPFIFNSEEEDEEPHSSFSCFESEEQTSSLLSEEDEGYFSIRSKSHDKKSQCSFYNESYYEHKNKKSSKRKEEKITNRSSPKREEYMRYTDKRSSMSKNSIHLKSNLFTCWNGKNKNKQNTSPTNNHFTHLTSSNNFTKKSTYFTNLTVKSTAKINDSIDHQKMKNKLKTRFSVSTKEMNFNKNTISSHNNPCRCLIF